MNSVNNIDWDLFKTQKLTLLYLRDSHHITQKQAEDLDGVINMMDAIQDDFEPITNESLEVPDGNV